MKFGGNSVEDGDDLHKVYIGFSNPLDAVSELAYNDLPAVKRESEQRDTRVTGGVSVLDEARVVELIEEVVTPPQPLGYVPLINNAVTGLPRYPAAFHYARFFCDDGFVIDQSGEVEDWQNGVSVSLPFTSLGANRMIAALRNGSTFTNAHCVLNTSSNALRVHDGVSHTTYNYGNIIFAGRANNSLCFVASKKAGVNGTYLITVNSSGTVADTDYNATLSLGGNVPNGNWSARAGDDSWAICVGSSVLANGTLLTGVTPVPPRVYSAAAASRFITGYTLTCIGNNKWFWHDGTTNFYVMDLTSGAVTLYTGIVTNTGTDATMGWAGGNYVVISWQDAATATTGGYKVTNGVLESNNSMPNWETQIPSGDGTTVEQWLSSRYDGSEFIVRYETTGNVVTLNGYSF
jgi:hypothetical protein